MARMNQGQFTPADRETIARRINRQLHDDGLESLLLVGSSNITYVSGGIVFPYLDQALIHPVALYINRDSGIRLLACTFDVADIPQQLGWDGEVLVYELKHATPDASLAAALVSRLAEEAAGRVIGVDTEFMRTGLLAQLRAELSSRFVAADQTLRTLRMTKTAAEVGMLEITGRIGDRGFISALNHAEGAALDTLSYPIWEYGERFRVHVGEFGGSGVGNLSVLQGERGRDLYSPTGTRETFKPNQFIRMEYSLHHAGYWATGARTVYIGQPDYEAKQAWADNVKLKQVAIDALRAGNKASGVYATVAEASAASGIDFWRTTDIGHGIGTAEREAPFLAPYDHTVLAPGMVVVVAVYTFTTEQALIGGKDIYLVTDGPPQLLTWYKNWDRLYALHGTSARHG